MLQDKDIENLLNGVDANDDGEVDYQEFISMMNKI
jgi:Ca2+-binding EF-hand superfamily protein